MKRLVSILLLAITVATGFAQSSTPDYIQKAKVGLTQYYPQFKDYFEPIFAEYNKLSANAHNIVNNKIKENFEIFDEELTTDRDKCAVLLISFEKLIGSDIFMKSPELGASKEDARLEIASEIISDINYQIRREIQKNEERAIKIEVRNTKLREILNSINLYNNDRESADIIFEKIEEFFTLFEINEINDNTGLQKVVSKYINFNKQINRRPSALGQKFIDEYNRITKSK